MEQHMLQDTDGMVREMVAAIVDEVGAERVYLFGSRVQGGERSDSDVDLLIVDREGFGPHRSRWRELSRIRRALARFRVPKDLLLFSADEVEYWKDSPNHIIGRCLTEGRLLYARHEGGGHVPADGPPRSQGPRGDGAG